MNFGDLIEDQAIAVGLEATDLTTVLQQLVERLPPDMGLTGSSGSALAADLANAKRGEIVRVNAAVVLVLGQVESAPRVAAAVGVSERSLGVGSERPDSPDEVRAVLLLLTPRRLDSLRERLVPALTRTLRDETCTNRLIAARSPEDVRALDELMATVFREVPLVEDALTPLRYRIFPDTPVDEIVDLMVRRELHAVPVVGESLEVLGIISEGDILRQVLPGRRKPADAAERAGGKPEGPPLTARDIMTRTVMCVSEEQTLLEAGNLMMNRDVEQLPVVREGELIGFVTRHAIIRRLSGE